MSGQIPCRHMLSFQIDFVPAGCKMDAVYTAKERLTGPARRALSRESVRERFRMPLAERHGDEE